MRALYRKIQEHSLFPRRGTTKGDAGRSAEERADGGSLSEVSLVGEPQSHKEASIEQARRGIRESDSLLHTRLLPRSRIQPNLPGSSVLAYHVIGAQHASERATPPCQWTDPIQHHRRHEARWWTESVPQLRQLQCAHQQHRELSQRRID